MKYLFISFFENTYVQRQTRADDRHYSGFKVKSHFRVERYQSGNSFKALEKVGN